MSVVDRIAEYRRQGLLRAPTDSGNAMVKARLFFERKGRSGDLLEFQSGLFVDYYRTRNAKALVLEELRKHGVIGMLESLTGDVLPPLDIRSEKWIAQEAAKIASGALDPEQLTDFDEDVPTVGSSWKLHVETAVNINNGHEIEPKIRIKARKHYGIEEYGRGVVFSEVGINYFKSNSVLQVRGQRIYQVRFPGVDAEIEEAIALAFLVPELMVDMDIPAQRNATLGSKAVNFRP